MHAEFSSILFRSSKFPIQEWEAINKPEWRYLGTGFDQLGNSNLYAQTEELLEDGFLNEYSKASLEEDFNTFAAWVFTRQDRLSKLALKHKRIRMKYELVAEFYKAIDRRIHIPAVDGRVGDSVLP